MIRKILFVISNISFGGAQRVTWTLCSWMKAHHVEPVVVAIGHSTNNYSVPDGIRVEELGQRHTYELLKTTGKMRRIIRAEQPDVVVTMGVATSMYSTLALWGLKIPHVISERNDPRHFLGKEWVKKASRTLMKRADGFVFQTEEARDFYPEDVRSRGCVIPNPLAKNNLPMAEPHSSKNMIVTMGRLTEQKNHRMLLDAFECFSKTHADYVLHIYGSGEMKTPTQEYIVEKGLEQRIVLFEACDDVHQRIVDAKMFVLSSDFEGMPNALMEAMAMGIPCISTDCPCGGPRYLIQHEENGLLIPVGDAAALEREMVRLADDPELCARIGQKALNVRTECSDEAIAKKWIAFCEGIIDGK